jgi:hypothetical protein
VSLQNVLAPPADMMGTYSVGKNTIPFQLQEGSQPFLVRLETRRKPCN